MGEIVEEVQVKRVLGDNKTFVDMVPQHSPATIMLRYNQLKERDSASLRSFVLANFSLPATPEAKVKEGVSLHEHLEGLWDVLLRKADKQQQYSSLLPLPKPYIVPGGRFREIIMGQLFYHAGFSRK
jgi:alpha,alpha-trehalase